MSSSKLGNFCKSCQLNRMRGAQIASQHQNTTRPHACASDLLQWWQMGQCQREEGGGRGEPAVSVDNNWRQQWHSGGTRLKIKSQLQHQQQQWLQHYQTSFKRNFVSQQKVEIVRLHVRWGNGQVQVLQTHTLWEETTYFWLFGKRQHHHDNLVKITSCLKLYHSHERNYKLYKAVTFINEALHLIIPSHTPFLGTCIHCKPKVNLIFLFGSAQWKPQIMFPWRWMNLSHRPNPEGQFVTKLPVKHQGFTKCF